MMFLKKNTKLLVRTGFVDMRKQINGLAALVEEEYPQGPFSGNWFMFCGKTRKLIKILYWHRNGFCLWLKRLERARFPWPKNGGEIRSIDTRQFVMIFKGIDFWNAHQEEKI